MRISVQTASFDPGALLNELHADYRGTGAVVGFVGYVRDFNDGDAVSGMWLEHYPGMTEQVIRGLIDEAFRRWDLQRVRVIHRVGRLALADQIVCVGVASAHRGDGSVPRFLFDSQAQAKGKLYTLA